MRNLLLLGTVAVLVSACGSQPPAPEQSPSNVESRTPSDVVTTKPVVSVVPEAKAFDAMSAAALKDPRSPLSKRMVYFDLDSFVVKDEYQSLLSAHAKFLGANAKMKMLIQGNGDERGGREYNLALAQKRADAIKKSLSLMGAKEDQMESVSLGEEKPVCSEQSEECWAKNRRGELLYTGEY
jgi:peptidoglycan-associated lipoprotein